MNTQTLESTLYDLRVDALQLAVIQRALAGHHSEGFDDEVDSFGDNVTLELIDRLGDGIEPVKLSTKHINDISTLNI